MSEPICPPIPLNSSRFMKKPSQPSDAILGLNVDENDILFFVGYPLDTNSWLWRDISYLTKIERDDAANCAIAEWLELEEKYAGALIPMGSASEQDCDKWMEAKKNKFAWLKWKRGEK